MSLANDQNWAITIRLKIPIHRKNTSARVSEDPAAWPMR
jgi:hypothetical protein